MLGRASETGALDDLLAAVRDGLSGVLVLRGEAGIGKSALLDRAASSAADMQVTRAGGAESEMDLGFAGLHQLLVPFLGDLDRLAVPQRAALQAAFGMVAGPSPDRFLVGLATLTLLTDAAVVRPVLCVVDDAQWLDPASAGVLAFVARRLLTDRVGVLFAVRDGEEQAAVFQELPELPVGGLATDTARQLLAASAGSAVDPLVGERIVAAAAGNPLALVEFGRTLTTEDPPGPEPLAGPLRFGERLKELHLSRVRALPADAQTLLLVAAADQLGDPAKVWRAAGQLGIGVEAAELPAIGRLVSWAPSLRFRQPLMRSIVYYGAQPAARSRVHEALAAVSDPEWDPDRRAWHLALAASGPDEEVAAELERSADRARDRRGWADRAAFLERSAELTPGPACRGRRLVAAAEARLAAGAAPTARALLDHAASDVREPLLRAQARRLEGDVAFAAGDLASATSVLLEAARMIGPNDVRLARDTLLEAFAAQLSSRRAAGTAEVLRAVRLAPEAPKTGPTAADLLLDGFTAVAERRFAAGVGSLRQAVAAVTGGQPMPDDAPQRFLALRLAANELYDDSVWRDLADGWVGRARKRGALATVVVGLGFTAFGQLAEGRFAAAEGTIAEARTLAQAMGNQIYLNGLANAELEVLACRGDQAAVRPLAARLLRAMADQGYGLGMQRVHKSLAILELGLGNYQEALQHALQTVTGEPALSYQSRPEVLVEAAVKCGDSAAATAALEAVGPWWLACGTAWSLGLLARCQALLADGDRAEGAYRLSIERLGHCQVAPELARSHLLYGEWLRRKRRRQAAREQLRTAYEMFDTLGMAAFAERAQAELHAVSQHVVMSRAVTQDALTHEEAQIARLTAEGATNKEIAAQLFVSASTVDYHLRKVFRKLDLTSRVQLASRLRELGTGLTTPSSAALGHIAPGLAPFFHFLRRRGFP